MLVNRCFPTEIPQGRVLPSFGPTRTEEDAHAHLQRLIASDPAVTKWHLILDNLNIHQSESLVRWVAEREGMDQETLGVKGKSGILRSMESLIVYEAEKMLHIPGGHLKIRVTPLRATARCASRGLHFYANAKHLCSLA
jgi:hypothetical protein